MADKDINERDVIKELLPHVKVMICLFHSLKTFKREINVEDMGITIAEKNSCLEFISSMAYSKTEIEYNGVHQQFLDNAPASVKNYFENNWHPIRDEWVIGYMSSSGNFLNRTNNRLESLNGKLKQVITKHSSLENFINEFFIILSVMRNERGYRAVYNTQKKKVQIYPPKSPEAAYTKLLTAYATGYVLHQLKIANNFQENYQWSNGASGEYNVQSSEGTLTVTTLKCSCCFFNSMTLPCRHIFSLRKKTGVSLFDRNLCANRWTNEYFEANSIAFNVGDREEETDLGENDVNVDVLPATKRRKRNAHEKYSEVMTACKKLANTLSLCSEDDFQRKLDQLKQLNNHWMENNEVGLQLIPNLSSTSITVSSDVDFSSSSTPPLVGTSTIDSSTNNDGHVTMAESNDDDDDDDDVPCPIVESWLSGVVSKVIEKETIDFAANKPSLTVTKLDIKMPPPSSQKGRPKGGDKTVIGLPKKATRAKNLTKGKPNRFVELSNSERERKILEWCVGAELSTKSLMQSNKISALDVNPTEIAPELYHPQISINSVKYLFEEDAWQKLSMFINDKKDVFDHHCHACMRSSPDDQCISCDSCLKQFHFKCSKAKKTKKPRHQWFCNQCKIEVKCVAVADEHVL